jgi:hypothetical protein
MINKTPFQKCLNTSKKKLLFFTCATNFYENYVTPYIYFAAKYNPSSAFEFIIDDIQGFELKHKKSIEWLINNFDTTVELRKISELGIRPKVDNSIRFCMNPKTLSEYVYIGDIDIIILEDIFAAHAPIFNYGLPYSNIIRCGTKQLTGLHLCRSTNHYPLGPIDDLVNKIENDEELLYAIIERKGLLYTNDVSSKLKVGRPVHGIHLSLNRLPFSFEEERVDWGLTYDFLQTFKSVAETDNFKSFFETLYPGSRQILINLFYLSEGSSVIGREKFRMFPY